jgi:hypothetical protein
MFNVNSLILLTYYQVLHKEIVVTQTAYTTVVPQGKSEPAKFPMPSDTVTVLTW